MPLTESQRRRARGSSPARRSPLAHARGSVLRSLLRASALALFSCAAPKAPPASVAPVEAPSVNEPWTVLVTSREGRPVRSAAFGRGPRRVLWIGGIHGDEREGERATAELPAAFLAEPGARERVTLIVIEDLNPDGS